MNEFDLLGVSAEASNIEIEKAYKEKMKDVHPDNYRGKDLEIIKLLTTKSQDLLNARDKLLQLSPIKRKKYYDEVNRAKKPPLKPNSERGNTVGNIVNGGNVAQKGEWLYYRNTSYKYKLYKIRTDGSDKTKLNDDDSKYINVVGDWVYYSNCNWSEEKTRYRYNNYFYTLYKIRTDGTGKQKVD